jgi:hypothetical protein
MHLLTRPQTAKPSPKISERRADWKEEDIGQLRDKLTAQILELSEQWKHDRAEKEERRRREAAEGKEVDLVESSDSEIDIVEDVRVTAPKSTAGPSKLKSKAARVR